MTSEMGTIKIPRDAFERHNARRKNFGETWAEYIDGQAPDLDAVSVKDVEQIADELKNQLSMLADPGVAVTENDVARMMEKLRELERGRMAYDDVRAAAREGAREAIEELKR